MEACCLPFEGCIEVREGECFLFGGTVQDVGSCDDADCREPGTEACCTDYGCEQWPLGLCDKQGGEGHGEGSTCDTADCPEPVLEACCIPFEGCIEVHEGKCALFGGSVLDAEDCADVDCPAPVLEACCTDCGCNDLPAAVCSAIGGTTQGVGSECGATDCSDSEDDSDGQSGERGCVGSDCHGASSKSKARQSRERGVADRRSRVSAKRR